MTPTQPCVCGHDALLHVPHGGNHVGSCTACGHGTCPNFTAGGGDLVGELMAAGRARDAHEDAVEHFSAMASPELGESSYLQRHDDEPLPARAVILDAFARLWQAADGARREAFEAEAREAQLHIENERLRGDLTPADMCRPVDVDGETIRVHGAGPMDDAARAAFTEVIRAARRKFTAALAGQAGAKPGANPAIDTAAVRALHVRIPESPVASCVECTRNLPPGEYAGWPCVHLAYCDEIERLRVDLLVATGDRITGYPDHYVLNGEVQQCLRGEKAEAERDVLRRWLHVERAAAAEYRDRADHAEAALARVRGLCEETQHGGMPADPEDADADWGAKDLAGKVLAALADAPPACCERRPCGGDLLHQDDCPVYLSMLADSLDELERTDPAVRAAADSYDAMVRDITRRGPCCDAAAKLARVEAENENLRHGCRWLDREVANEFNRAEAAGHALEKSAVAAAEAVCRAVYAWAAEASSPPRLWAGDGEWAILDALAAWMTSGQLPDPPAPADPLTEAKIAEAIALTRANIAFMNRLAERIEADRGLLDRLAEPAGHRYRPGANWARTDYCWAVVGQALIPGTGKHGRVVCGLPADHPVHQPPAEGRTP